MKSAKITAAIITFNEEKDIARCLEHLKWADDIVIVDSFSEDRTVDICKKYTDKIYQQKWLGFGRQRNHAIHLVDTEWVLCVDADEVVPKELAEEIREAINSNQDFEGYEIRLKNYFLGKPLRFSDQELKIIRLFRTRSGSYEDREVHERPIVKGKIGKLRNPMMHFGNHISTIWNYMEQANVYTDLEVQERLKIKNHQINFKWQSASARMRLKYIACYLPFKPVLRFLWIFVLRLGFLDGYRGLLWAMLHGFILEFLVSAKLYEYKLKRR
ncbi:MAG: glycosyltransferase family 2 protein [Nitrospirae bacterium]|nr:glycosyltransferase family 2 protein [Nitrospirota bacterium]